MARTSSGNSTTAVAYLNSGQVSAFHTAALSVAGWMNFTSFGNGGLADQSVCGAVSSAFTDGYVLRAEGTSSPCPFKWYCFIAGSYRSATSSVSLNSGTWYHLGAKFDGSSVGTIYVNGINEGTFTQSGSITYSANATASFQIGNVGGSGNFNGSNATFAEVAFWSAALTDLEFSGLATGQNPSSVRRSSLVGYWPIYGLTSPEVDLGGSAFNGTLTTVSTASWGGVAFGPPVAPFTPRWPQANNAIIPVVAAFKPQFALGRNVVVEGVAT